MRSLSLRQSFKLGRHSSTSSRHCQYLSSAVSFAECSYLNLIGERRSLASEMQFDSADNLGLCGVENNVNVQGKTIV